MAHRNMILTRKRASETNLIQSEKGKLARESADNINNLPEDLIMEIFARFPMKYLARFRCVCKHWHSSLTNPEFTTNHAIRVQENPNAQKVVCFCFKSSLYRVNLDKRIMFDVNNPSANNKEIALPIDTRLPHTILGSCNGLIFVSYGRQKFYLLNPLTGESRHVFNFILGGIKPEIKFAFGYDSSTKDYKIIRFRLYEPYRLWVFSLKKNSWRKPKSEDTPKQVIPDDLITRQAVQVGGFLHWQVASPNPDSILTFDLAQEKFGELINIPRDPNEEARVIGVSVLDGCLCITRKSTDYAQVCSIWAMKEYGVAESWTKLISLKALRPDTTYVFDSQLFPMCYIKKGRVLLLQNFCKIILYDLEMESFRELRMPGARGCLEVMMTSYVESLVSPKL
ncbi:hypothetical protein COLO4_14580 [Corchorus olitorius]|uniref:F-box domain-containing protein n=1 Tax=Corchorus olitorius TaxID=93759 RepID=A0A1R3JRJ1_9ROSI|nr:hypothetical protein COLO4_14580 [Corchorus olitorius]